MMSETGPDMIWRITTFVAVFAVMVFLERVLPKRGMKHLRFRRWLTNLSIVMLGSLVVRLMALFPSLFGAAALPLVAVSAAYLSTQWDTGLLNILSLPGWLEIVIALLVLDFAIWLQHLISHKIPVLWRLHRVHHADPDFDVTTAIRFHPIEIALSMLYKVLWVLLLGPSVLAVVLFEIILSSCAMFNHGNVALPGWLDRQLRAIIVTPDMHRVHHSTEPSEHHTNYGFNLSVWDRLFRTYKAQPATGHLDMAIGLKPYQSDAPTKLAWSLLLPFK